jgi:protein SCO1/2
MVAASKPGAGPRPSRVLALLTLLVGFALAGVTLAAVRLARPRGALPVIGAVPTFTMRDQRDRVVTDQSLRGAVSIVDFFFTSCPVSCPRLTGRMAALGKDLAAREHGSPPRVRLVSITVDPETDTPAKLAAYAERYQADAERWWFLSGPAERLGDVVVAGFKVRYEKADPALGINEIMHGNWFVLVDRESRIRGYYLSDDPERIRELVGDAERLADGAP